MSKKKTGKGGRNGAATARKELASVPTTADVGVVTPRPASRFSLATSFGLFHPHGIGHQQAVDWFGPHTPHAVSFDTLQRMRQDETIALTLRARKSVIASAEYRVECDSDEVRQFAQDMLDRHKFRLLWTGLMSIDFGFVLNEIVWDLDDVNVMTVEQIAGQRQVVETAISDAFIVREIRDHSPASTQLLVDEVGDFVGARVATVDAVGVTGNLGTGREIPRQRAVLYTHQGEFGNLHGRSGLLPAYNPWWWGNVIKSYMQRYFEQKGDPPLIGRAPDPKEWSAANKSSGTDQAYEDPIQFVGAALMSLRSSGAYVMPSMTRVSEDGTDTGQFMFDVKVLDVPERNDEFVKALHYLDLLKVRAGLGNDLVVLIGSPGQAGAKQGGRMFHTVLRPDQEAWAGQTNEQFIRPLVEANFGADAPATRIIPGVVAENKLELMFELVKVLRESTQTLPDGRKFQAGWAADVHAMLEEIGLPTKDLDTIAEDPEDFARAQQNIPRPVGRPPGMTEEAPGFQSKVPQGQGGGGQLDRITLQQPPIEINSRLEMPEGAIHVNIPINVEAPEAPDVTLNIPKQDPPTAIVNEGDVNVHLDVDAKTSGKRVIKHKRDMEGNIRSSEIEDA